MGEIWVVESGMQAFGIQNTAQGIRNPTNGPSSTVKKIGIQFMESGIHGWNPESKTDLYSLAWAES